MAIVFIGLDDNIDQAFEWLEKAFTARTTGWYDSAESGPGFRPICVPIPVSKTSYAA